MSKVFFSDNGSTAVECALKMALQYCYNHDSKTKRIKIIGFKGGYHGDTFGAMSAAGKNEFNHPFWGHLFEVEQIDPPFRGKEEISLNQLRTILQKNEVACFIFEPLVMGAGGMLMYPAEGLNALLELCHEFDVLTIADEVMTGFGRTGTYFACDQLKFCPDLICLSKGITGGFLPLGATLCSEKIYRAFLDDSLKKAFLHGHSYTANPLACSSALASLDLLLESCCLEKIQKISLLQQAFCQKWNRHPKLNRCESTGTILALEYQMGESSSYYASKRDFLYDYFLNQGILVRPLGHVLYILPPYCILEEQLEYIYEKLEHTLEMK
jgi:adenosylmethionine-8-amino-7-oxononanoate aminotransferase